MARRRSSATRGGGFAGAPADTLSPAHVACSTVGGSGASELGSESNRGARWRYEKRLRRPSSARPSGIEYGAARPLQLLSTESPRNYRGGRSRTLFIVATQDHSVHPDLHRDSAKQMGATTCDVDSGYRAMLSHPDVVLDAVRKLVTSRRRAPATA
jgi:hypothetical protein